ncbi:MAG: hypothetical protein ACLP5E_08790 [Streptosporangiaceae bacterium]
MTPDDTTRAWVRAIAEPGHAGGRSQRGPADRRLGQAVGREVQQAAAREPAVVESIRAEQRADAPVGQHRPADTVV